MQHLLNVVVWVDATAWCRTKWVFLVAKKPPLVFERSPDTKTRNCRFRRRKGAEKTKQASSGNCISASLLFTANFREKVYQLSERTRSAKARCWSTHKCWNANRRKSSVYDLLSERDAIKWARYISMFIWVLIWFHILVSFPFCLINYAALIKANEWETRVCGCISYTGFVPLTKLLTIIILFVRPKLNYCSITWNPYHQMYTALLEKILQICLLSNVGLLLCCFKYKT